MVFLLATDFAHHGIFAGSSQVTTRFDFIFSHCYNKASLKTGKRDYSDSVARSGCAGQGDAGNTGGMNHER
jgi:hypothetical protein